MMPDRGDGGDRAPTGPAIGGIKGTDSGLVGVINRHDHGALRAHNRLSPDDSGIIGRRGTPCGTAISRGARFEQVAGSIIVPFNVAMPIETAGGRVITSNPFFVEVLAP